MTNPVGLTSFEVARRQKQFGVNRLKPPRKTTGLFLLLSQFNSPIIVILLFAAVLAGYFGEATNTLIILLIIVVSGLLGYWQERGAVHAVTKLLSLVQIKVLVVRDGSQQEISIEEVVPGDAVILSAGDVIPGDAQIIEEKDLTVDESTLTGETFPVEKETGEAVFMGTHVISGTATVTINKTGRQTKFGQIYQTVARRAPETEFEHGVRHFGYLLLWVTIVLTLAIFAANIYLHKPLLDSFLFSIALAVGLTPQLLPAIISINLAHGAKQMAARRVIVKRLASIENFGSMDVLCCDKTGTLTEGVVAVQQIIDLQGNPSEQVGLLAYLNSSLETGFTNPIDQAIRQYRQYDTAAYQKSGEVPYDFNRKRLSILLKLNGRELMITKGAVNKLLEICVAAEVAGQSVPLAQVKETILKIYHDYGERGYRLIAVAKKAITAAEETTRDHETGMTLVGFIVLADQPKQDIVATITRLKKLGISLKMITGDNRLVAGSVAAQVGIVFSEVLTGEEIFLLNDDALAIRAEQTNIFAEIEPNQKERLIRALKKSGHVVGYLGDGINDATALHTADVGISVEGAVDVAKEAADIVLLAKDLRVLSGGVEAGRQTFSNTLKYVFMATSANFGNMFSMAGISLFLPFLPLLPTQVLLTNLLTDFPEMTIATDHVDREMVDKPRRWNIRFIRDFMVVFGLLSSLFDYLTFGALIFLLRTSMSQFRTGWFMESVISAAVIVLVIRTHRPFLRSVPGPYLLLTTMLIVLVTIVIPYTRLGQLFGFTPLAPYFLILIGLIVGGYILLAEVCKKFFYHVHR